MTIDPMLSADLDSASYNQDTMDEAIAHAVAKERERCSRLNDMLADIFCKSADRMRKEGSFTTRAVWPPFKKVTHVAEKWQRAARDLEAAAHSLRTVAHCIHMGYDPDDTERKDRENEKINLMQQEMTPDQKAELRRRWPGVGR